MPDIDINPATSVPPLGRSDARFLRRWQRWHRRFWMYLVYDSLGSTLCYALLTWLGQELAVHGQHVGTWGLPARGWPLSIGLWLVLTLATRPAWYQHNEERYQRLVRSSTS